MPASQEDLSNVEQQLASEDTQLAMTGIARSITEARERVASADEELRFRVRYDNPDDERYYDEAEIKDAENKLREADYKVDDLLEDHDKLFALSEDEQFAERGDEGVISKYAQAGREYLQAEHERLQAKLEDQRHVKEANESFAVWVEGTEIDGAASLSTAIEDLASDPNLAKVRGEISASGWKFAGAPVDGGERLMFERLPVEATGEPENNHYRFRYQRSELLTIDFSEEDGASLEYAHVTDVDEEAAKRYGKNIANVETYKFKVKGSGKVGEQKHYTGPTNGHLPYFMHSGMVARAEGVHGITPEPQAELGEVDIQKMQDKIAEVTAAMKDLTAQNQ